MNCAAVYAEKRYSVQECDARDDPMENKCPVHKKILQSPQVKNRVLC